MFYIKTKDAYARAKLARFLTNSGITAVSHYVPLHSYHAGKALGEFVGEDYYTTRDSERLLRLPLYYDIKVKDVDYVVGSVKGYYDGELLYVRWFYYNLLFNDLLYFR